MTLNVIDDDNVENKKSRQHLFDIIYNVYCTKYFIYTCLVSSSYIIDDETLLHSFLLIHGGDDHHNILLIALSIVICSTMMIMMNRQSYPIPSMCDIFTYIWLFLMVKYGKCRYIYQSHGCYGY